MTSKEDILYELREREVSFLQLMFTDILGSNKNVEVPASQFSKALDGEVFFDGSSIEGFVRIEESDMLLKPDLETFSVLPWEREKIRVARIICDVSYPDGSFFEGCPRTLLKGIANQAREKGWIMNVGPEAEFFLFKCDDDGKATTIPNDRGGYFEMVPFDEGEEVRQQIVLILQELGYEVEAAHHEVAIGQHEIDFKYSDVVKTADNIMIFKFVVRKVAMDYGLHATFMPKPLFGVNGSGMHTHQSLFNLNGENIFFDPQTEDQLSDIARYYMGGLLKHAKGFTAITNPTINSYKRLVPGFEAPTHIVWSKSNRSPLIRVPASRENSTRIELRMPDPSCNPYLAFGVMLSSGLWGIANKIDPGKAINKNIFSLDQSEREKLKIETLPKDLHEAIHFLAKNSLMYQTLKDHIFNHFILAKRRELQRYISHVHPWEIEEYLY